MLSFTSWHSSSKPTSCPVPSSMSDGNVEEETVLETVLETVVLEGFGFETTGFWPEGFVTTGVVATAVAVALAAHRCVSLVLESSISTLHFGHFQGMGPPSPGGSAGSRESTMTPVVPAALERYTSLAP